jgi:putative peptide zinc metalloprotease protein
VSVVETRVSVWEALAGRAPGQPVGPADPGMWAAVVERLNPARAKPVLRPGIEAVELVSVRDVPYVMLRSPDDRGGACYLRFTPHEWRLAQLMDGSRTVARLVAEFARIGGRLAPDQVTRVVADLAGNRMLAELPVDAFRPLARMRRRPWPVRYARGLIAFAKGRRTVIADVDRLIGALYRAGGRVFFTRPAAVVLAVVAVFGLGVFGWIWWRGDQSVFLTGGSYPAGSAVLLGLNVFALACHELAHALATKHAGRRVPAAGFLVYFGIPSVYVDTTDVWMAGRRARMITTAAGPATGLVLAGVAQIVGLVVPEAAPWLFKLSFAWYLNALFNLNPFLALDGYYLLMDWLEIPNLRARGLSYVIGRLRRRPPTWVQLDREGRLIALYGTVAVLWLVIAVNLGWRIWTDRVSGLVTGLWRAGWPARLLLAAVICGLTAPLVYLLVSWLAGRWRGLRQRLAQRSREADQPRRLDALRVSALARLPAEALSELADVAMWVRPRTGQQLVFAGAAQPDVLVVVDGALEGRRPDDPSGLVRQRVGGGGVVGLASALRGGPASLAWHTAGTTLLAVPSDAVVRAIGPLPGPTGEEWDEAETLFREAPALAALSAEDLMGLVASARPMTVPPGGPVVLEHVTDALVVESGVVALADGTELRRGTVIGPIGEGVGGEVATARTSTRLWTLPALAGQPLLLGAAPAELAAASAAAPGGAPASGVHPIAGYPPLAAPPGPPPPVDDEVDRRFERRMWWLVLLLLLLALLITASNFLPGPAWAEMRTDRAMLVASRGTVAADIGGRQVLLTRGGRAYLGEGDAVEVRDRSTGTLTFRGGSVSVLCAGTSLRVGPLWSDGARRTAPHGSLDIGAGRVLADTASRSTAFRALALKTRAGGSSALNDGEARYAVQSGEVDVSTGVVRVDGTVSAPTGAALRCGDGRPVERPAGPTAGPMASGPPSPSPSPTPTASPTPSPTRSRTSPRPVRTTQVPPTNSPTPTPPPPPPPDRTAPVIGFVRVSPDPLGMAIPAGVTCAQTQPGVSAAVVAGVTDATDPASGLAVSLGWTLDVGGSGGASMSANGSTFSGAFSVPYAAGRENGGTVTVTVTAVDKAKNAAKPVSVTITLAACTPPVIG